MHNLWLQVPYPVPVWTKLELTLHFYDLEVKAPPPCFVHKQRCVETPCYLCANTGYSSNLLSGYSFFHRRPDKIPSDLWSGAHLSSVRVWGSVSYSSSAAAREYPVNRNSWIWYATASGHKGKTDLFGKSSVISCLWSTVKEVKISKNCSVPKSTVFCSDTSLKTHT